MRAGWRIPWGGLLAAATLVGGCGLAGEGHVFEDGACRVVFPSPPTVELVPAGGKQNAKKASLLTRHGALSITAEDAAAKGARQADEHLDLAVNAAVLAVNGKTRTRKKVPLAVVYPGRAVLIESQDGQLLLEARLYLAKGRLYQLAAAGPAWWIESAEVREFFRSFEVVGE